ncbi:hypothetical protein, partial [Pseudomonas sp. Sample_22]|uniref:hypothetical protein n=1 Tax=Pseudomonas sp. Sample_22 TaxID=2448266 RepID=UPI0019D6571F
GRAVGDDMYGISEIWKEISRKNDERRTRSLQRKSVMDSESPIASLIEFLQESSERKNWD